LFLAVPASTISSASVDARCRRRLLTLIVRPSTPTRNITMELEGIDHVALTVRDVEEAAKWYADVLGFERRYEGMWDGIPTFIGKGNTAIALFPARGGDSKPAARTGEIRMLHLAFRANRDGFLTAQEELRR